MLTSDDDTTPWIGLPGGLSISGIACIWNQWRPWREKFSRQPFSLSSRYTYCASTGVISITFWDMRRTPGDFWAGTVLVVRGSRQGSPQRAGRTGR